MKIAFSFVTFFALIVRFEAKHEEFDLTLLATSDDVLAATFPRDCPKGETLRTGKSQGITVSCNYQKGSFGAELKSYAKDVERLGCYVDSEMADAMHDSFGSSTYVNNPIYKRMGTPCGYCGIQPACCGMKRADQTLETLTAALPDLTGASPFFFEHLRGTHCPADTGAACAYNPLTSDEFATLQKMQPYTKNVDKSNGCNFGQFGYTEWESARENPSFPLLETVYNKFLCRGFNSNRPRVNCIKDVATNKCMCCCHNNFPQKKGTGYVCVENNSGPNEKICYNF